MTKKLLSVLLAVSVMLTAMVCGFAFADGTGETGTDAPITVTFDANTGDGTMDAITVENGTITVPECTMTKTNYEFQGWNTVADGSGTAYEVGATVNVTESITLYAQWAMAGYVEYTVTYDANGGEGETVDDWTYISGDITNAAYNNFTREGYEFKEWNTAADGSGTAYLEGAEIAIGNADVVLYAIWTGGSDEPIQDNPPVVDKGNDVPVVDEPADVVESDTDAENEIPATGDAAATAIALTAGVVALGAFVVLKKKN